jgi:RNA polymerase sigma factor (TIGR02999 family)
VGVELAAGSDGDRMLASCYEDMRRVARNMLAGDGMRRVLQPTDLAHEAAIRMILSDASDLAQSQGHLLALAARTMRRVLIDEARRLRAAKRHVPTMLTAWPGDQQTRLVDLQDLDQALEALDKVSNDHATIVEMRFSLGMTVEEITRITGIPERTVKRRWQAARAWLHDFLRARPDAIAS